MEAKEKLDRIIADHLGLLVENLTDDISYELESKWDSVTHLKMVSEIENSLNINFDIDEIVSLETVGKIREMVMKKTGNESN